jgi:hypothetical protein
MLNCFTLYTLMRLRFSTPQLEAIALSVDRLNQEFGKVIAAKICQRLWELASADCLATASQIPTLRISPSDSDGRYVIPIFASHRILLRPALDTTRARATASRELAAIKTVYIISIEAVNAT